MLQKFRRILTPISAFVLFIVLMLGFTCLPVRAGSGDLTKTVQSGAGVIFYNNSASSSFIHIAPAGGASECKADYAVYNSDGTVKAFGTVSRGLQNVPAGGRVTVTNSGSNALVVYGDSGAFSSETSSSQALVKVSLPSGGGSAVFTNTGSVSASVYSGSADYAVYNSDGTLSAFGADSSTLRAVPSGGRLVVTNSTKSEITAYAASEAFICEKSAEPALLRVNLAPEATVVYTNVTSADCSLTASGKVDFAAYDKAGIAASFGASSSGTKTVSANGKIVLTNSSASAVEIYGASEVFTSDKGSVPALIKNSLAPGASVQFTNLTSEKVSVYTGSADYACYDGSGSLTSFSASSSGFHETIAYGRITVTNSSSTSVIAYAPSDAFTLTETDVLPALLYKKLVKGETITYVNGSSSAVSVYISKGDYASYDGFGTYSAYGADASGMFSVPSYGKITVTNSGTSTSTVYGPQGVFKAESSDSPALLKTTLKIGETIIYINISSDNAPVYSGKADYCLSVSGGAIVSFGAGGSGEYKVEPDGSIKFTNTGSYPISITAPSKVFIAWNSTEPALYMTEIAPNGKAVYYSTADYEQSVYVGKCQYVAYKYNGSLSASRYTFGGGTVEVPAGGRIEVINNGTSFISLYGPYSCFAAENNYMYKYDIKDAGLDLKLPLDALDDVNSSTLAVSAVKSALDSFSEEQFKSVTAIERLSLFMENAASRAGAASVTYNEVKIDAAAAASCAEKSASTLTSFSSLLADYKVTVNRSLRSFARFKCNSDNLNITVSGDFTNVDADRIVIDAPSFDLYLDKDTVAGGCTIKASYMAGAVTLETSVPVMLGLDFTSGDVSGQVLKDSDGNIMVSKYNHVTRLIEGTITKNGTYSVGTNTKDFGDMSGKTDEMKNAVSFLASRGIINGTSSAAFSPDAVITRAEIAAMLVRLLSEAGSETDGVSFTDIRGTDWFRSAASVSARLGLISGYEDGTFKGRNVITKNEILTVAARLLSSEMGWNGADTEAIAGLSKYTDKVAEWAKPSIALCSEANIYPERVDGSFTGGKGMTRGDAAIIIYRLYMLLW